MASYDQVIKAARNYIGYLEKNSPDQLDSMLANAGRNNYTRFARDYEALTGNNFQGQPWCAMFVSCVFVEAYGLDKAKSLLGGELYSYCPYGKARFKALGRYYSSPKAGDIIFFLTGAGDIGHTGLVYQVDSAKVYTIEGNASGSRGVTANGGGVFAKSYSLRYKKIDGYGRPNYEEAIMDEPDYSVYIKEFQIWLNTAYYSSLEVDGEYGPLTRQAAVKAHQTYLNVNYQSGLTVDGIWNEKTRAATVSLRKGNPLPNDDVKVLQGLLYGKGLDPCGIDGKFGTNTEKAVNKFQKTNSLTVDGIAGKNTFTALLS